MIRYSSSAHMLTVDIELNHSTRVHFAVKGARVSYDSLALAAILEYDEYIFL